MAFVDDFNRADSDTVGAPWVERSGDYDISSNGIIQTDALSVPGLLLYDIVIGGDHWIEGRLAVSDGSGQIGLSVRCDASLFTCVNMEVADGNYKVLEVDNGSPSTVSTGAAHTHATGELFRAETEGTAVRLFLNDVLVHSFTTSFAAGNTRVGFHINESASGAIRWDDFRAGAMPWTPAASIPLQLTGPGRNLAGPGGFVKPWLGSPAAEAVVEVTGTVAETQDDQTSTAAGVLEYTGTVAETQADQTSTATGVLGYTGTLAEVQADQISTAAGQLGYSGTLSETQDAQTSAASGTVGGAGEVTGTLAETQDAQTSTATGQLGYSGVLGASQANQTAAGAGWIEITGTLTETQANQTGDAAGQLGATGTVARTQANQTAIASGWITITGLVAITQANQTCTAVGFVGELPTPSGHPLTVPAATHQVTASGGHRVTAPSRPTALEVS